MAVVRDKLTVTTANERVDELVRKLQASFHTECRITVDEVVKGGSLGHGTAVPGDFDLDLVLYSRDIDPEVVLDIGVDSILDKLDRFLRDHFKGLYQFTRKTSFSLQFKFHDDIDVDLLPSPYWEKPDDLHRFLEGKSQRDRNKFSCSAAKWQVKFFKDQPNEVKEYIKRFKAWRNRCWPKGQDNIGRPKSFLLGLLMVEAYRNSSDKRPETIQRELIRMIKNHQNIQIKWNDGYYDGTYCLTNQEFQDLIYNGRFTLLHSNPDDSTYDVYDNVQKRTRHYVPEQLPYIKDVANPFNNVYQSGIGNYFSNDPEGTYRPGTGKWTNLVQWIDTFDPKIPVENYYN